MLSFSTEFPIRHSHDARAFIHTVRAWILGSPYTKFAPTDLEFMDSTDSWSVETSKDRVVILRSSQDNDDAVAVRYSTNDGDLDWITDIVFSKTPVDSWVSVRVSCESNRPIRAVPFARKPIIVRLLLEQLGGSDDGPLAVSKVPRRLKNDEIDLAAQLLSGHADCYLPIVYVSSAHDNEYIIDPKALASNLAGMAHVVVEPNRPFSWRLKIEVKSQSVYGGTIGIYWPEDGGRRSFFLGREYETPDEIKRAIFEEIRTATTNRRPLVRCTWSSVQEAYSKCVYNTLKQEGSQEVDKYTTAFDAELRAKETQLSDANREIDRLKAEARRHASQKANKGNLTLETGNEQDLYAYETQDFVLVAIADHLSRVQEGCRRQHILGEIIKSNPLTSGMDQKREILKNLLRDYRSMDARVQKGLEDFGFDIQDEGKHYKLVFNGDARYTFILSKTGGDRRGGLNVVSDISKQLF